MAKRRAKITPEKLGKLYYVKNRSMVQVAELLGCSPTTVRNHLRKHHFKTKTHYEIMHGRKLSEKHKQKIVVNLRSFKGDKV